MKYFETKHEKDSAKLTALLAIILLLLIFIVGPKYFDPPLEFGVAVNFGTTDFGSGDIQPKEPIKSEVKEIIKEPEVVKTQPEASLPQEKNEDVITQNNEESIAIKKQKEAKAKAIADAKAEAERMEREKRAQEEQKKKLDALIGGIGKTDGTATGSEGNDNQAGDKGQLDGDPYASYIGTPGTGADGIGYGLNGRGKATDKTIYDGCENEYGVVVINIVVNRDGDVIEATTGAKGTKAIGACLLELTRKIALSFKWPADAKAPARQYGKISINTKYF